MIHIIGVTVIIVILIRWCYNFNQIDVETLTDTHHTIGSVSWHCAEQKARMQMNECERHVASNIKAGSIPGEDRECFWEENIVKYESPFANRYFIIFGFKNFL